jgi:hypothetical protein
VHGSSLPKGSRLATASTGQGRHQATGDANSSEQALTMHRRAPLAVIVILTALAMPAAVAAELAAPRLAGGTPVPAEARGSAPPACAPRPTACAKCDQAGVSPIKVGENFPDTKSAIAAANKRLDDEHAAGFARELRVGWAPMSLLLMESNGMGGLVVLRQDPSRVCVIGAWAWDFGGNEVSVAIAAVAQAPTRDGAVVVLKAIGRSPHGTDPSSYEPDTRLLSAFLITVARVDEVLGELVDEKTAPSYDEWPEPVRIEASNSSLRIVYRQRAWVMGPDDSQFVLAKHHRRQR